MATNQEKFDQTVNFVKAIKEATFDGGDSMPEGLATKDWLVKHVGEVKEAIAGLKEDISQIKGTAPAPPAPDAGTPSAPVALTDGDLQRLAAYIAAEIALGTFKFTKEG